jgi:hypothetical protein
MKTFERSIFTNYEELLFTRVVALAEKAGKHVSLLVVPSSNYYQAAVRTAAQLHSAEVIAGRSPLLSSEEQVRGFDAAWDELPTKPTDPIAFIVVGFDGHTESLYLGAKGAPEITIPTLLVPKQSTHIRHPSH